MMVSSDTEDDPICNDIDDEGSRRNSENVVSKHLFSLTAPYRFSAIKFAA